MPAVDRPSQRVRPALPADIWGLIARATLHAEGTDIHAWERLCRVCRTWRAALTGVPVAVAFTAPMTLGQVEGLLSTGLPLRSLRFEPDDAASCIMLQQAMLKTSRRTLQVLQHVYGPRDGRLWAVPSHLSLTRFGALRSLTLHECPALGAYWLRCLPTSLRSLTFCVALHDRESAEELSLTTPYPAWSLAHLIHLEDFTLWDDWGGEVMIQLLQSSAVPVLPASLRTLCQDAETIGSEQVLRTEPLAAVTIPVLHRRSEDIILWYFDTSGIDTYFDTSGSDTESMAEPAAGAELPVSFRALWLQTRHICIEVAQHSLNAELSDESGLHAAEELCRFLALAPACYEELRLLAADERSVTLQAEYCLTQDTVMYRVEQCYDDLQAVAVALRRFADLYGLALTVSDDETFLSVVRVRPVTIPSRKLQVT